MLAIPVIDLMNGHVVHARRGARAAYQPIRSPLAGTALPVDIVRGLLSLAPFTALYCADLDAIQRRGDHRAVLARIAREFPSLTLWVDAGFGDPTALAPWLAADTGIARLVPVIGTESLAAPDDLSALLALAPHAALSLDTLAGEPLGPPAIFASPERWPARVIVMTLDRVGAAQGPAFERLRALRARAPATQLVAAGGVRNAHDLEQLDAMGVHGVLLASALHNGALDATALTRYTHP